ncbi:MAG: Kef-type K+ transport system membrane component KefB, partial [Rhodococcus sp. (in: high G+C Gram-positive bacteria)]
MPSIASSLFWIALIAAIAPIVAGLIPRRLVPEVVLLLVAGAVVGPFALNIAADSEAIGILRELGLGMLFLLAGYEIDRQELSGRGGRRALYTWLFCLALAFTVVSLLGMRNVISAEAAVAIAMTSTALGTLLPILKDNKLLDTRLGKTVLNHGAVGELGPVVAMAVLLSARGAVLSLIVLAVFALIAVIVAVLPGKLIHEGSWTHRLVRAGADTTAQTTVRLTVLLLVSLGVLSAVFSLDVILGAFAAGFILRRLMPEGDERLEIKLDGIAFGFLIPIFFITSGMAIDVSAVAASPGILIAFLILIVVVRGVPVFFVTKFEKVEPPFTTRESAQVALYGATGLPMIVAVT